MQARNNSPLSASATWRRIVVPVAGELLPPVDRFPDEWAAEKRSLKRGEAARPGPFDPALTPYMIPFQRAFVTVTHKTVVMVCGSQMGKTDSIANIFGHRIDDDPAPLLYIAPTQSFVQTTWDKRLMSMVRGTPDLARKFRGGKTSTKFVKVFGNVTLRAAWAGSPTEVAGDVAAKVIVDEYDRMKADVGGEGDPKILGDNRHATFIDGQTGVTSTPLEGNVDAEFDDETGIEHWLISEDIQSATWRLWQLGTRHEWSWPCPECRQYFVPRFKWLYWPDSSSPAKARREARLICPNCDAKIENQSKAAMNAAGRFVSPGQRIKSNGTIIGDMVESGILSFWVSGLASPFKTWGERAATWLEASGDGDPSKIKAAINTAMGELYVVKGEAPDSEIVAGLRLPYRRGEVPLGVLRLTMGVDVQVDRLVFEVRGWGENMESWLIDHGELWGETDERAVWDSLDDYADQEFADLSVERCMIDSGFRAEEVYEFCRRSSNWAVPSKGRDGRGMDRPLGHSIIDTSPKGRRIKGGLGLWHINTDYFKQWVHRRLEREPDKPGAWHISQDTTDDYLEQIIAEERITTPTGRVYWQRKRKANHYFDTAVLNTACAYSLGIHSMVGDGAMRSKLRERTPPAGRKQTPNETGGRGFKRRPGATSFKRRT